MAKTTNYVGKTVTLTAGTRVNRIDGSKRLTRDTTVTIIAQEAARNNKTRVFWKSNGYRGTNTLV